MPPAKKKAKKTAPSAKKATDMMWLVTYEDNHGYGEPQSMKYALFDSLDRAISGGVDLMDANSRWSMDWRNGLPGLGREDEDDYVGCNYTPMLGSEGGTLISNEDNDGDDHKVKISIKQLEVNPTIEKPNDDEIDHQPEFVL